MGWAIDDEVDWSSIDHDGGPVHQRLRDALFRAYFTEGRNVEQPP